MEPYKRRQIQDGLGQIEHRYLQGNEVVQGNKDQVHRITKDVIHQNLQDLRSDLAHTGSAYELTAIPGKSDYDLQFYLKVAEAGFSKPIIQDCGIPGWKKIKGGPEKFLDSNGYLSPSKVRQQMQSSIQKAIDSMPRATPQSPNTIRYTTSSPGSETLSYSANFSKMSTGGPATTLHMKRDFRYHYEVDVVAAVKSEDLLNGQGYDLVAKPLDKCRPDADVCWRMSYSVKEKKLLHSFNINTLRRKLTLLKMMKVIKSSNTQLKMFPSYFYKNILFWLHERYPDGEYWTADKLSERFIDMIGMIRDAISNLELRNYFNSDVNLLSSYRDVSVKPTLEYLNGIITRQDYISLINGALADFHET